MRLQDKVEGSAVAVPTPLIACSHAEKVNSRRNICVVGDPGASGVHPALVIAFQLVLEFEPLRIGKTGRCEMKFEISVGPAQTAVASTGTALLSIVTLSMMVVTG